MELQTVLGTIVTTLVVYYIGYAKFDFLVSSIGAYLLRQSICTIL